MDEEKAKLYYIVEQQAKLIKMQAKDIDTLTCGVWSMFFIFVAFAIVNMLLSFYLQISNFFTALWIKIK